MNKYACETHFLQQYNNVISSVTTMPTDAGHIDPSKYIYNSKTF